MPGYANWGADRGQRVRSEKMNWPEELRDILRKMRECETNAARRSREAKASASGEVEHMSHEYYSGQANGFRNAAHYIESLLKSAEES